MTTEGLVFRAATLSDLDRILEIHLVAFPDARTEPERRRNFTASRFGSLDDLILLERRDEIVGHAFLFRLEAWFGGCAVKVGGIASVAIAAEARGQGLATALLDHVHCASAARGDALTMLYPFRQSFYARFGYGTTSSRKRLMIDPASIPSAWRGLAKACVRRPRGEDRGAIEAAYVRSAMSATKASGWLTRSTYVWDRSFARERTQFLVADGASGEGALAIAGYVAFEVVQAEVHAATKIVVEEIVADDDVTRRALLGALASMRSQVAEIELEVDAADPLDLALIDADGRRFGTPSVEHTLGVLVGGPMVRIENVPLALTSRGYAEDGAFDLVVDAGALSVSVRVEGGVAHVSEAHHAPAAIRMTRTTLASLLYGGLRLMDAARLGLAEGCPLTLARVDAIMATAPLAPLDPF